MHKKRSISRTIGEDLERKEVKMRGVGAATKGSKWYAVENQLVDEAKASPQEWVSTVKKA